jgi:RPA family protein
MENNPKLERETAYKVKISRIVSGNFVKQDGWQPNYIKIFDKEVSRVNVIGTVIEKQEIPNSKFESFILDDGSAPISLRSFEEEKLFSNINFGDNLLIIGRPRQYGEDIYIVPEIIKKIEDPRWIMLRKKELEIEELKYKKINNVEMEDIGKNKIIIPKTEEVNLEEIRMGAQKEKKKEKEQTPSEKVYSLIKELDQGLGASYEDVIFTSKMDELEAEKIIKTLLLDGDIFEVRPGRLKIL